MKLSTKKCFRKAAAMVLAVAMVLGVIPFANNVIAKGAELSNGLTASAAEAGVEYNFVLAGLNSSEYPHTPETSLGLLSFVKGTSNNGSHGLQVKNGSFTVKVAGAATITIKSCKHANDTTIDMNGEQAQSAKVAACGDELVYEYVGGAGEVTFNVGDGSVYIHEITVKPNPNAPVTTVWNFRGGETGAYDQKLQGSTGTGNFNGIAIDATSGKLYSRFDKAGKLDTQINANTKLTVPVPANSDYTIVMYARTACAFTVDGNAVTDKADSTADNGWGCIFTYSGSTDESTTSVDVVCTENGYIKELSLTTQPTQAPAQVGNGKVDVYDFAGQALEGNYNNLITTDIINGCYPGVEPGTTGVNIESFTLKDSLGNDAFKFVTNKTNNRWRIDSSVNVTKYDAKNKSDADGNTYLGFLYSNNTGATPLSVNPASTNQAHVDFYLYANDILTCMLGSNGNAALYALVDSEGNQVSTFNYSGKNGVEKAVFYAPADGWYTLYCTNEKLVLARATVEHTVPVKVTGTATYNDVDSTGVAAPSDYSIKFTNKQTGAVTLAPVKADGSYKAYLYEQFTYDIALEDANGYVVYSQSSFELPAGSGNKTVDISIKPVKSLTITGKINGVAAKDIAKLAIKFKSSEVYVPEIVINEDATFTLKVEAGITYDVIAENALDYTLKTTTFKADADGTQDITFEAKPVYDVTVTLDGMDAATAQGAIITLTNTKDKYTDDTPYVYTFKGSDKIQLRDGQYKIVVTGVGKYAVAQAATPNVKVNGAATTATVKFNELTTWDFSKLNANPGIETIGEKKYYSGLALSDTAVLENKTYLLVNKDGEVKVPVKAGDNVILSFCYQAAFAIDGVEYTSGSGSTSKIEKVTVVAKEDGVLTITGVSTTDAETGKAVSQTYFTMIDVVTPVEYKEVITVGADKDYKTINEALAAVSKMNRPNGERVTIMIDPGNYEEMLVINDKNITLKNAAKHPSIELTNKGVDIADSAVRITSYYGHGYAYYSMGSDCKYDAELLEVNKANGYLSFENPGSGTTSGSYWNATVVVYADGFEANGIIFENSFNQYVSEKAANDVIVPLSGAKEDKNAPRASLEAGSVKVQEKAYVERAAALAIANGVKGSDFYNCKFVGRQDTLYGGTDSTVVFEECSIYGGTDYIFGGMKGIFYKCDLVANTSADKNDTFYITAAQQTAGRGYLMYNCTITSTKPGIDTASETTSKPGYLGRPWQGVTSEVVFYKTIIDTTNFFADEDGTYSVHDTYTSLIEDIGWLTTLGGKSDKVYEYGTKEMDNSTPTRADWSHVLTEAVLGDETPITMSAFVDETWLAALQAEGRLTENTEVNYDALNEAYALANKYADKSEALAALLSQEAMESFGFTQVAINQYTAAIMNALEGLIEEEPITPPAPTGDTSNVMMWISLFLAALAGIAGCVADKKRKRA